MTKKKTHKKAAKKKTKKKTVKKRTTKRQEENSNQQLIPHTEGNAQGNGRGRPTKYRPEYAALMEQYFDVQPNQVRVQSEIDMEKVSELLDKGDLDGAKLVMQYRSRSDKAVVLPANFPTLAGFATMIRVDRQTLWEWSVAKNRDGSLKYPDFSYAYKRAKDYQEKILVENGLLGAYQGNFAIFTAKNVLGWRDDKGKGDGDDPPRPEETAQGSHMDIAKRIVFLMAKGGSKTAMTGRARDGNTARKN